MTCSGRTLVVCHVISAFSLATEITFAAFGVGVVSSAANVRSENAVKYMALLCELRCVTSTLVYTVSLSCC